MSGEIYYPSDFAFLTLHATSKSIFFIDTLYPDISTNTTFSPFPIRNQTFKINFIAVDHNAS